MGKAISLIGLFVIFFVVFLLSGGRRAIRGAVALLLSVSLVVFVLIPASYRGYDPVIVVLPCAALILFGSVALILGRTRKAFAALVGSTASAVVALAVGWFAVWLLSYTGLDISFGTHFHLDRAYWYSAAVGRVNFERLLIAGLMLSALGASMDVSVTVASAMWELAAKSPEATNAELREAARAVGREVAVMMTIGLLFIYFGSNLSLLLLMRMKSAGIGLLRLLDFEGIGVGVVRSIAGCLALVLSVPVTIHAALRLDPRKR